MTRRTLALIDFKANPEAPFPSLEDRMEREDLRAGGPSGLLNPRAFI